jgi:phytoene synthase
VSPRAGDRGGSRAALRRAFAHCARVTRANAKNFFYAFAILPRARREAMYAVYAFCRAADDISDEPGALEAKREGFARFREALEAACAGRPEGGGADGPESRVFLALADVARRYGLSKEHLVHVVDGCEMDLVKERYATFEELGAYLDRVASAVGRITIQLFGLDPESLAAYAVAGGYAVQLTNILRDVKEDFERGRVYIPAEDLARFGVTDRDLAAEAPSERFRELMRFEVDRARRYYADARAAIGDRERRRLLPLEAIVRIYSRLLDAIEQRGYDVLSARVAVPGWRKAALGLDTLARARLGLPMGR